MLLLQFHKWTDNSGGVHNVPKVQVTPMLADLATMRMTQLPAIVDEEEEDEEEDDEMKKIGKGAAPATTESHLS